MPTWCHHGQLRSTVDPGPFAKTSQGVRATLAALTSEDQSRATQLRFDSIDYLIAVVVAVAAVAAAAAAAAAVVVWSLPFTTIHEVLCGSVQFMHQCGLLRC